MLIIKRIAYIAFIITIIGLGACKRQNEDILLSHAQDIVNIHPDSALALLDSITLPKEGLSSERYMEYIVAKTQANYKNYKDISRDTLIFEARRYFTSTNENIKMAALSSFYAGCVYNGRKETDKTTQCYLQAYDYAMRINDSQLLGMIQYNIGSLYYQQNLFESAITRYQSALDAYEKVEGSDTTKISLYNMIGSSFLLCKKGDSANVYYSKALQLAEDINNPFFKGYVLRQMGTQFREEKEYDKSVECLTKALVFSENSEDSCRIYLNLAKTLDAVSKKDSSEYYINKLVEILPRVSNDYICASSYNYLTTTYRDRGNYLEALNYSVKFHNSYRTASSKEHTMAMLDMEHKYNLSQKENEVLQFQTREQVFTVVLLLIATLLCIAVMRISHVQKGYKATLEKNALLDKRIKNVVMINALFQNMTLTFTSFENEIEALSVKYGIKEKSKGYEQIQEQQKKLKKMTKDNLSEMAIEFLEGKAVDRKILNTLSSTELSMLALAQCGYESKDVSSILSVTTQALHMRKKRLEEKLRNIGISDGQIAQLFEKTKNPDSLFK